MKISVVIPARDEEELIERCLVAVSRAARFVEARIIVVADNCIDDTALIARRFSGVEVLELAGSNVGAARAAGVAHSAADWVATTDADSIVPPNWLSTQLELATEGADVVVGTVRPSRDDLSPAHYRAWQSTHENGRALGHVHGANLGFRTSAYRAVGGFTALTEHEDADLVHRLRSGGYRVAASDQLEVVTSGRRMGRTPGGYARYLHDGLFASLSDPA